MCGRRVEGWRGLMPAAGEPDTERTGAGEHDAPQAIAGQEEQTRPVRPSANLAAVAASASEEDAESRRPTGEVPSLGHELRARAPDQRVHTSPIGNVLPSDVQKTLDDAVAAQSGDEVTPLERPGVRMAAVRPPRSDRSGRTAARPTAPASERRSGPRGRRSGRIEFPVLPVLTAAGTARASAATPAPTVAEHDDPRPRDRDAPVAVAIEPTQYIGRRRHRPDAALQALRTFLWALLWLGIGGAVAFGVVLLLRHPPPARAPGASVATGSPPAPPRRPPPRSPASARPPAATPPSPGVAQPRAHDLVVPIPAAGSRPPAYALPPAGPPAPAAPAPANSSSVPAPPLDPQEQAAFEQTMSNIEFVVSERIAQVRACYDRAVRSAGPDAPGGHVEVALTLSDDGIATGVSTLENTVGSTQLAGCLEQRITEWRFPRPLGSLRTFRLPFTFSPSPEQSGPRPRLSVPARPQGKAP